MTFIKTSDVDWIGADDYYIKLHVARKISSAADQHERVGRETRPENILAHSPLHHHQLDRVKELHQNPNGEYVVVLKDGTELKLSRNRRERLEELLMHDHD